MQIIFFQGLQPGDYADAHLTTWRSEDDTCIWINTRLVEEYPRAQILSVSYGGGNVQGSFDTEVFAGKLIADLMQQDIGNDCPVILIGHCFGGLVINHLCILDASLHSATVSRSQRAKLKNFLASMRGIFYYSNPHLGIPLMNKLADERLVGRPFMKYFKSLSTEAEWLDAQFSQLRRKNPEWIVYLLYLSNEKMRDFYPTFMEAVTPSTGARETNYHSIVVEVDHLDICQTIERKFNALQLFLNFMEEDAASRESRLHEEFGTSEDDNPQTLLQSVETCYGRGSLSISKSMTEA